jgi:Tol biopolymer transport system component/DNA-binding winged helix-turn-helix (wHTH) protein
MSYRFDDVEIDREGFRVTRGGDPVRLEPKALEILFFLAANPGRLVSKSEIQGAVWKDTFVTEGALTRLVAQIRRGLGDDAREARYIETVPTRGYRFVARLEGPGNGSVSTDAGPPPSSPPMPHLVAAAPLRPWAIGLRIAAVLAAVLALLVVGLAVWRWTTRPAITVIAPSGPAARLVEQQVSTRASLNLFPCFSPDGASIAYSTLRDGSMEIVLRALAPGAREVPITSDGTQNLQPAFSPDGRLIAFHSVGRGGLWIVPSLGGVPRQLTRFGSHPAWSPDGSEVAFQGQSWVGAAEGGFVAGEGSTLWVVRAAGGEPRRLTTIAGVGPGGQGAPAWSPDGQLVSFLAGSRVMVVRRDGSGLRETGRDIWATGIAWEKTGRSQVWTGSAGGNWLVWRVPVSPATGEAAGTPQVLASGGEGASAWSHPAVSPDGRSIAHVTFRTRYEILSQRVGADGRPAGEPEPIVPDIAGRKVPLGFSPDGRRLSFGTMRPGVGRSLWVADVATGEARLVSEQPGVSWARGWFPDGRRLGYVRGSRSKAAFWTIDADTGETREQTALPRLLGWPPLVSPDGTRIASHGALEGGLNVWVVDVAGGAARQLTDDPEGVGWPVWSPDGTRLAVEMMRGGDTRIGWLPAGGGPVREIVTAPGQSWPQSFSPDGRRIAFAGQRRGLWNVYSVPVEGGPERPVTAYATPALYVRYPQWSPRGDRIAYEFAESTSTVWMTELPPAPR